MGWFWMCGFRFKFWISMMESRSLVFYVSDVVQASYMIVLLSL